MLATDLISQEVTRAFKSLKQEEKVKQKRKNSQAKLCIRKASLQSWLQTLFETINKTNSEIISSGPKIMHGERSGCALLGVTVDPTLLDKGGGGRLQPRIDLRNLILQVLPINSTTTCQSFESNSPAVRRFF